MGDLERQDQSGLAMVRFTRGLQIAKNQTDNSISSNHPHTPPSTTLDPILEHTAVENLDVVNLDVVASPPNSFRFSHSL